MDTLTPFKELKTEGIMLDACELRQSKYLNNLVEQDHRAHLTAGRGRRWVSFPSRPRGEPVPRICAR